MSHHNDSLGLVLLVEDHIPLLRNMGFLLEIAGFDVIMTEDGEQALKALGKQTPDLIISDVNMPNVDGFELLRRVRSNAQWRNIPLIFASARYEMEDLMYGLELGANDYVPKPFDIYDMLDAIQRTVPQLIGARRDRLAG
jgi:two-component system alkaline phosphatase synthesis response regulator PhoP